MNQENKEKIIEFVQNYIKQDNRMTRWPYAYVVQQEAKLAVPEDCGDYSVYRVFEDRIMSMQQIEEHNSEVDESEQINKGDYYCVGDVKLEYQDVQWFFTEAEALKYLERDAHNLRNPRTYVKYFNRNSEAEFILKTMFALAGEDYEKHER